jgi:hypothetical protein
MRAVILAGVAALFLASCGANDTAQEGGAGEENVASEVVATNDVTAIDAATGEAANMAADVDYMPEATDNATDNAVTSNGASPTRRTAPARTQPRPRTRPAEAASEPAETNSAE